MQLEQQVCSLDLAKRLKELGVKQESIFWHWTNGDGTSHVADEKHMRMENVSAFTVAELGEMLYVAGFTLIECPNGLEGFTILAKREHDSISCREYGRTEADARAKMLIYLIENKLI